MELKIIVDSIIARWIKSEYYENIAKFENAPLGASTGTEGLGLACRYIRNLKEKKDPEFLVISDLAEQLFEYADRACRNHLK